MRRVCVVDRCFLGATVAAIRSCSRNSSDDPAKTGEATQKVEEPKSSVTEMKSESNDPDDDREVDINTIETKRWIQKAKDERKVDENGEFIVSQTKWHTGKLAYTTPPPPGHLDARFGYQIVTVKKPVSWWAHYRKYPRWSFAHVHIHLFFLIGVTYLCSFLLDEIRRIEEEQRSPRGMVGDQLGRGALPKKDRKIAFSVEETEGMMSAAQEAFMAGDGQGYAGSKDYTMKKIPRPKEFSMDDALSKYGVAQPKFTAAAKPSKPLQVAE